MVNAWRSEIRVSLLDMARFARKNLPQWRQAAKVRVVNKVGW